MAKTGKELRQELGELTHQYRAVLDRAESEQRKRTGEEDTELKNLDERMNALELEIPAVEKLEARERIVTAPAGTPAIRPAVRTTADDDDQEQRTVEEEFSKRFGDLGRHLARRMPGNHIATRAYAKAYQRWMTAPRASGGQSPLSAEEQRALSVGVAASGGFTVPQEQFLAELIKKVDDLAVIRGLSRTFQVPTAQSLGAPTLSADPADPDWTSELAIGGEDSTMAFGKREMHPWPIAKYIKISDKLLRASPLGMEGIVRDRLAYKLAVAHSKAFNTGDGASKPLGLYTPDANGISTVRDVDISTSSAFDADKLITARFTLRPGYWPNARWHMHRNVLAVFRKLKTTLQYLWQPGLIVGAPNTLLDFPYVIDEYAPSATTGLTAGYVAILGDFSNYWIVDALDVRLQRLDELFALTNQVAFVIRAETDAQPVLEDAFVRCIATVT